MKLDILAFGAHPDDVELSCGGTLFKHASSGKKTGIIDLTMGELGSRGNAKIRLKEADAAKKVLNVSIRENLKLTDGFFVHDKKNILAIVKKIRQYQPDVVICNAPFDRHPDHGRAANMVNDACFLSGLIKIKTSEKGKPQPAFRPQAVYHYIQFKFIKPDFTVDISPYFEKKMEAIWCHASQFYNPQKLKQPETFISKPNFMSAYVIKRSQEFGKLCGCKYAEGFIEAHASEATEFLL